MLIVLSVCHCQYHSVEKPIVSRDQGRKSKTQIDQMKAMLLQIDQMKALLLKEYIKSCTGFRTHLSSLA